MRGIVALLGIVTLAACGRESTSPSAAEETFDLPADQVAYEVRQTLSEDGVRSALLYSDTAYIYEESRSYDLRGVDITFFDDAGAEAGTLTSERGNYEMEAGRFVARGNVVLISEGPSGERRLESEQLIYDIREDILSTQSEFTLHEAGRVTTGTSFRSDSQFRTWEVEGVQTEGSVGSGEITF